MFTQHNIPIKEHETCSIWNSAVIMSATTSEDEIRSKWTLHWLVWNDDHKALDRLLKEKEVDMKARNKAR